MRKTFLVTTDHMESGVWFREKADFVVGMNHVAIQAFRSDVTVCAFILMSNHVHFVLHGLRRECIGFVEGFKQRFSKFLRKKYGVRGYLRHNALDIREVSEEDEGIERAVAYVHMNCVAANICANALQYPWGTGGLFFNESLEVGERLDGMSERKRRRLFHSRVEDLPGGWSVGKEGVILTRHYVDVEWMERVFRSPKRMNFFLMASSKARRRLEAGPRELPAFRDQVLIAGVRDLCMSLFHREFEELNVEERGELMRQMRFRFSAGVAQLARVLGLKEAEVMRGLESV